MWTPFSPPPLISIMFYCKTSLGEKKDVNSHLSGAKTLVASFLPPAGPSIFMKVTITNFVSAKFNGQSGSAIISGKDTNKNANNSLGKHILKEKLQAFNFLSSNHIDLCSQFTWKKILQWPSNSIALQSLFQSMSSIGFDHGLKYMLQKNPKLHSEVKI